MLQRMLPFPRHLVSPKKHIRNCSGSTYQYHQRKIMMQKSVTLSVHVAYQQKEEGQMTSINELGFVFRSILNDNHLPWMWNAMEIFSLQSHSPPPPVCNREVLPAVVNLWQKRGLFAVFRFCLLPRPQCCWRASWRQPPLPPTTPRRRPRRR